MYVCLMWILFLIEFFFEWYMARLVDKIGHQKDACDDETEHVLKI